MVLRYDFSAAARHVADFLVIMKSRDPGSNINISGVDTDQGGGMGWGCGGVPGRGGQGGVGGRSFGEGNGVIGILPQDAAYTCTHVTKSYYPADQYNRFTAAEKQKF